MEDSDEEIDLPAEFFEFNFGTYEVVILVDIPHFSTPNLCTCDKECDMIITTGRGEPDEAFRVFGLLFKIRFYPNGIPRTEFVPYYQIIEQVCENENYVSAFFETCFGRSEVADGIQSFSIGGFLGVIDVDENFCKRQTFGASYNIVKDIQKHGVADYEIGLERFLNRKYLLEESELYLRNDTLRIRCEITFSINGLTETYSFLKTELFQREEIAEKWFHYYNTIDETTGEEHGQCSLVLNQDSLLGKRLQEKSPYFKCVFGTSMKEGTTKLLPIEDDEFKTFYNMVSFIRFDTLDHVRNVEECVELYIAADKYEVVDLTESCRKYFLQSIKVDCAAELLMFFDVYKDPKMKEFITQFILANWYEIKLSDGWKVLEEERRDLIREILYMIEDIRSDTLLKDNECLKAFKMEMECYSIFPKYRKNSNSFSKSHEEKLERAILQKREQFRSVEVEEEWFKHEIKASLVEHSLKLNNPRSFLCLLLQRKSSYFKNLFATRMKERVTKLLPIEESEYQAFYNLMCYIRFETLDHIRDIDECLDLYILGDKYDILDLYKYCREFIQQNLTFDKAAEVLVFSETYKDKQMKEFCIQFILSKWLEVKESDGWKVLEEERQYLIQEIILMAEDKDIEILPKDNENVKVFLKEMKCYRLLPTDRTILDKSVPSLIFFDLISVHNQELVIAFILEMAYEGYETANNMGYFEYKDFIYIKQEDLIREIMRFIKKELLKYFVLKRECLQVFNEYMKNSTSEVLQRRNKIAANKSENFDGKNHDFLIQSILYRWVKLSFSDDWRWMRAKMIDDDAKENRYKLLMSEEFVGKTDPKFNLTDLDFNDLSSFKNQIIVIEYLLASWSDELSFQFLDLTMKSRLNLYQQSLFVYKEKDIINFKNDKITEKFQDQNEHADIHHFYE